MVKPEEKYAFLETSSKFAIEKAMFGR